MQPGSLAVLPGDFALHDLFNFPEIAVVVQTPAAPVTFHTGQKPFALPPEKRCTRDIKFITDLVRFVFLCAFACDHGALSDKVADNSYTKYSYDDTEIKIIVKLFLCI